MQKLSLIIVFIFLSLSCANAQNFQFGQYDFSEQRINPGLVAGNNDAEATLLFRNQGTAGDFPIKDTFFSIDYPLNHGKKGKRWGGLGLYFLNDKQGAGNAFNWDQVGLSYAFSFEISPNQTLNLGISGSWNTRKFTYNDLITESQFVGRSGFNRSLANGEEFGRLAKNFLSIGTGIFWHNYDQKGNKKASLGFGISDINSPDVSLVNEISRLKPSYTLVSSVKVYENKQFSLIPELLVFHNSGGLKYNFGPNFHFPLDRFRVAGNIASPYSDIALKYGTGNNIMASVEFGSSDWAIGINYETGNKTRLANTGTLEIALKYKREIRPKKTYKSKKKKVKKRKKKKFKKNKSKRKKRRKPRKNTHRRAFDRSRSIPKKNVVEKNVESNMLIDSTLTNTKEVKQETIQPIGEPADKVDTINRIVETKVERIVRFEFDTDIINGESKLILERVIKTMNDNPEIELMLTGHTDNVGSLSYNQGLSFRRAKSVKTYLVKAGIDPLRLFLDGKGETTPISDNSSLAGRLANRRVEIQLK